MAVEVLIPEVGDGIKTGNVLKVLVKPGDSVSEGQGLIELETDKALVEVPSTAGGVVEAVLVKPGDTVPIGSAIVTLKAEGAAAPAKAETATAPAAKAEAPAAKAEPAAKASAPAAAPVGTSAPPAHTNGASIAAAPSTRRLAREFGIELSLVPGTGRGGRVTQEDLVNFVKGRSGGSGGGGFAAPPLPDFTHWGAIERMAPNMVRRKTAEHMALSHQHVAPVTQFERVDITDLEQVRQKYGETVEAQGGKLTLTVLLIPALVSALKAFPDFNASFDYNSGETIRKRYYNFGIAVDTERGLLVPVLRDVDKKDVFTLARELGELGERARSGKSELSEFSGGSFTISNQGALGGAEFTPIVNWPEVAILGVGRARWEGGVVGGQLVPRLMLPLGLSYDHRVIDGASAARFIKRLKDSLEDPVRLFMGL
ncbi:2-oxo acid dehydrogenase subunit E2 [bacterium]|nr:2-oxo acid dehydrogenase subunit E2 [bacterium]